MAAEFDEGKGQFRAELWGPVGLGVWLPDSATQLHLMRVWRPATQVRVPAGAATGEGRHRHPIVRRMNRSPLNGTLENFQRAPQSVGAFYTNTAII